MTDWMLCEVNRGDVCSRCNEILLPHPAAEVWVKGDDKLCVECFDRKQSDALIWPSPDEQAEDR